MSGTVGEPWWNEPAHAPAGLVRAISASLGNDLVIWTHVDADGHVSIVDLVDPDPAAQAFVNRLRAGELPPPDEMSRMVVQSGEPLLIARFDLSDVRFDSLAAPWQEYLARHPILGFIGVPVPRNDGSTDVLMTARRSDAVPYSLGDLGFVRAGAAQLAGFPIAVPVDVGSGTSGRLLRRLMVQRGRRLSLKEFVWGSAPPAVITALLLPLRDAGPYRPGSLMLLGCVVAAVFAGMRAAVLAAVSSTIALWWAFTPEAKSWRIASRADAVGLAVFVAAVSGVILLVRRVDEARKLEQLEHQLSDTLLEQSPVAMAVFDRDLRFRRVNTPMAAMNGLRASLHVGLRPGDLSAVMGQLYEHLLAQVRDTGVSITDRELSVSLPEVGLESHWRASFRPLRDRDEMVVGIGAAMADVTNEMVARRHAEQLERLAESLSKAVDAQSVSNSVCAFLVDSFHGRSAVAMRDDDNVLTIQSLSGFTTVESARWRSWRTAISESTPLAEAARTNLSISLADPSAFNARFPELASVRTTDWDQASLSMPLRTDPQGPAIGVMYVGWATPRPITEAITTLVSTVSALVSLALARIAATNQAHQDEFRHALDAMLDNVSIGRAVRSDSGDIDDFLIEFVNSRSIDGSTLVAETLVGRLMCDVSPSARTSGLFDRIRHVVNTGEPYQAERLRLSEVGDDGTMHDTYRRLQVAKLGDGYISASRDVGDLVKAEQAALQLALLVETERTAIALLQSAALPSGLPQLQGVHIAAAYQPADPLQPIGGDWYDAFTIDDHRVALVIADVAGHGRSAAVFMVQVRNVFRALAVEHTDPGEVLARANSVTCKLNELDGPFVTCCYAVLDVRTHTLLWAQAGHFSPLVIHADGTSNYQPESPGPPLALLDAQRYESSVVVLQPGDRVLMFTDGLVERRREHLDIGLSRLAEVAKEFICVEPQEFVDALAGSVTDRFDDLAVLCVEISTGCV